MKMLPVFKMQQNKTTDNEINLRNYDEVLWPTGDRFPIMRKAVRVESNRNAIRLVVPLVGLMSSTIKQCTGKILLQNI